VLSVVSGGQAPTLTQEVKADGREIEVFAKAVDEGKGLGAYLLEVLPADMPQLTEEQAHAFAAAGRGIKHLDVTVDQLKSYKAPTLFIHGSKESEDTKERAAVLVKRLGRGEIKVIDQHGGQIVAVGIAVVVEHAWVAHATGAGSSGAVPWPSDQPAETDGPRRALAAQRPIRRANARAGATR